MRVCYIIFVVLFLAMGIKAQNVGINASGTAPNASAGLDIDFTNKGLLIPRMTTAQRDAIVNPAQGLMIFNTTTNCYDFFNVIWQSLGCASCNPTQPEAAYGTVTGLAGAPTLIWIDRNLGATAQATSVTDSSIAAAGCYYQFNRSQSYGVYGTTNGTASNPAWTITSINENSDWIISNDPCRINLGSTWRIPTNTEWTNVVASGAWTNENDAFASVLKLHLAGYLNLTGLLSQRGVNGGWWSSTQNGAGMYGNLLSTGSGLSLTLGIDKAMGFTLRCVK